ncbi:isochorismatase family protein [Streptomyces sp. SID13666]|uniref:isochorismatase family protein n=1 Tax=unclassified Streptomyces TaxID=2593676 RepID=UPI0013BFCF4C|nr:MULTISPECIES: isochorismatase family protein [unclassified Streptomyces]NEA55072.1 isochorismatase family protein [Streptomyces sp. SID13666]NEA71079.1 isochorismatase family protein [Streptomyces sp. SID13588]
MAGIPPIEPYAFPAAGDLPANTAQWTPDPDRAVLLVHDMQRYFLAPFPDSVREPLVSRTAALRDRCASVGVPVAYTVQPGSMTEKERGLLMDFWGPGMRRDPADRAVVDALTPRDDDWQLTKWRYSAFHNSPLLERMRDAGRDQLIICGVYAHVGILMTALEAFTNDIQVFLVGDAVADFNERYHRMALDYAAERCAMVVAAKEVFA